LVKETEIQGCFLSVYYVYINLLLAEIEQAGESLAEHAFKLIEGLFYLNLSYPEHEN